MIFTKSCEYGIKAAVYITRQAEMGLRSGLHEIATEIHSPRPFTAKILQQLTAAGLVESVKGPNGGFTIQSKNLRSLRLIDIVEVIDGDQLYTSCVLGFSKCKESRPCLLHNRHHWMREQLRTMLTETKLTDLTQDIRAGKSFFK